MCEHQLNIYPDNICANPERGSEHHYVAWRLKILKDGLLLCDS